MCGHINAACAQPSGAARWLKIVYDNTWCLFKDVGKIRVGVKTTADNVFIKDNSKYLLDILSQLSGDTVKLLLSEPNSPCLVLDPNDEATLYVLMPMRV